MQRQRHWKGHTVISAEVLVAFLNELSLESDTSLLSLKSADLPEQALE